MAFNRPAWARKLTQPDDTPDQITIIGTSKRGSLGFDPTTSDPIGTAKMGYTGDGDPSESAGMIPTSDGGAAELHRGEITIQEPDGSITVIPAKESGAIGAVIAKYRKKKPKESSAGTIEYDAGGSMPPSQQEMLSPMSASTIMTRPLNQKKIKQMDAGGKAYPLKVTPTGTPQAIQDPGNPSSATLFSNIVGKAASDVASAKQAIQDPGNPSSATLFSNIVGKAASDVASANQAYKASHQVSGTAGTPALGTIGTPNIPGATTGGSNPGGAPVNAIPGAKRQEIQDPGAPTPSAADTLSQTIAKRTLGDLSARQQWANLANEQTMAMDPYLTSGAKAAERTDLQATQAGQLAKTESDLALAAQQRAITEGWNDYNAKMAAKDYPGAAAVYNRLTGEKLDISALQADQKTGLLVQASQLYANGTPLATINANLKTTYTAADLEGHATGMAAITKYATSIRTFDEALSAMTADGTIDALGGVDAARQIFNSLKSAADPANQFVDQVLGTDEGAPVPAVFGNIPKPQLEADLRAFYSNGGVTKDATSGTLTYDIGAFDKFLGVDSTSGYTPYYDDKGKLIAYKDANGTQISVSDMANIAATQLHANDPTSTGITQDMITSVKTAGNLGDTWMPKTAADFVTAEKAVLSKGATADQQALIANATSDQLAQAGYPTTIAAFQKWYDTTGIFSDATNVNSPLYKINTAGGLLNANLTPVLVGTDMHGAIAKAKSGDTNYAGLYLPDGQASLTKAVAVQKTESSPIEKVLSVVVGKKAPSGDNADRSYEHWIDANRGKIVELTLNGKRVSLVVGYATDGGGGTIIGNFYDDTGHPVQYTVKTLRDAGL